MAESVQNSQTATKLVDHIRELRKRLLICIAALVVSGIGVYLFYEPVLNFLRSPLHAQLFYSSPSGSFSFVMKICFMGALAVAIPVIIFNLIMFIRPAFTEPIPTSRIVRASFLSAVLAFAGAAFGFYYIIPGALRFFAGFQVSGLSALISADSYLGFVTNVIITFVLIFQLPLLISFIDRIKPLRPRTLLSGEKWVVIGSLVISVLVPFAFDIVTTLLIALPIIVLYNMSVVIVLMQHVQARRTARVAVGKKARLDLANMPESTLSLELLSFEDLVGEPVMDVPPVVAAASVQPKRVVPIESIEQPQQIEVVQPAAEIIPVQEPELVEIVETVKPAKHIKIMAATAKKAEKAERAKQVLASKPPKRIFSVIRAKQPKIEPVIELETAMVSQVRRRHRKQKPTTMDIRSRRIRPAEVTPPDWVRHVHDPIPLDPRARLISL